MDIIRLKIYFYFWIKFKIKYSSLIKNSLIICTFDKGPLFRSDSDIEIVDEFF